MNASMQKLYADLEAEIGLAETTGVQQAEENLSAAEKAKQFVAEKRLAIERLKEISDRRLQEEEERRKKWQEAELVRKRQAKERAKAEKDLQQKELLADLKRKTRRFWVRKTDFKGLPGESPFLETGVVYVGEFKQLGDAWIPHGHGEYRLRGEVLYEGGFCNGKMHGKGEMLFTATGESWVGGFDNDSLHGYGVIVAKDDKYDKRAAIYRRNKRMCFVDELTAGVRLRLLSTLHFPQGFMATLIRPTNRPACFVVRFDTCGEEKTLDLSVHEFELLRTLPRAILIEDVLPPNGGIAAFQCPPPQSALLLEERTKRRAGPSIRLDSVLQPRPALTSDYTENWFYPKDLKEERELLEKSKDEEALKLRNELLSKRAEHKAQIKREEGSEALREAGSKQKALKAEEAQEQRAFEEQVRSSREQAVSKNEERKRMIQSQHL